MDVKSEAASEKATTKCRKSFLMLAVLSLFPIGAHAGGPLIFAAASTADALNAALAGYQNDAGLTVRVSYASSGALARQIDHGAPAALYISADVSWMAWLDERARLAGNSRKPLFGNSLVLIEPKPDTESGLKTIPLIAHNIRANILGRRKQAMAIADPDHAPAGAYAKEALEALGLWETMSSTAVRTRDVRAALFLVERGEAGLGIVYRSDALRNPKVRILNAFHHTTHRPIRYHLAIVKEQDGPATRQLYAFLQSRHANAQFRRFGFITSRKFHGSVKSR